jgi:phosphoglycolate phosphatase
MLHLREHLAGKTHVIWDWNGTLLDDLEMTIDIVADVTEANIGRRLGREEYLETFRFPIREYYQELGFDFAKVSFEELSHAFVARFEERVKGCELFAGTRELLDELRSRRVRCSILTAAQEDNVKALLGHFGIDGFFENVYGLGNPYARSKIDRGRQLLELIDEPRAELVLVGDTDHDFEVGHALGIDVVLLTEGHQSRTRLERVHSRVVARG